MREKTSFKVAMVAIAIAIVVITIFLPTPADLPFTGKMLIGILVAAIVLWITEAIPILITAWLFAAAVPLMGIMTPGETWSAGVSVAMVLCISCFAFALFVQTSTISTRVIAFVLKWSGNNANKALAGFMIATGLLSMIIDDLVLVIMMLPFAYKILDENKSPWGGKSNLAKALILGIAFSSYIGGWITPVGSIVNVLAMGFAEQALGVTITFANWMVLGIIMNIVLMPLTWFVLVKVFKPEPISDGALARIAEERSKLPGFTKDEVWGMIIMLGTMALWIAGSWVPQIDLVVVGLVALGLMFLPPFKCIDFRQYADESPWQVVMINWAVGCFVAGMMATGAMTWLVTTVFGSMGALPLFVTMLIVAVFCCLFHNILPAGAAVAGLITIPVCTLIAGLGGNISSAIFLCAMFSSSAFLLPLDLVVYVAYSSDRKYFSIPDQIKAGWAPSLATILMVAIVIPAVCTVMGLA